MTASRPWLDYMLGEVGYHEGPNNDTKFGEHYHLNHEPWCATCVSFCCEKSGYPLPSMQSGMPNGYAAVVAGVQFAQAHGLWIPSWKAQPGDAICYGWNGPHSTPAEMHTGLIVKSGPKGSLGHTVEGNRGDQVERQTFTVGSDVVLGCIDFNRLLLGRPNIKVTSSKAKTLHPTPQPRHPDHPHNTGPGADKRARDLSERIDGKRIATHKRLYRRLRRLITKGLHRGK